MDPLVGEIKAGISGLSEVISLADDLDGVAKQVQDLGKKELAARQAWRRKQKQVNGDYGFVDAVDEWRRVKEAREMREQVRNEVISKWGEGAWAEILVIEERQKADWEETFTEDGHDRKAMAQLKWYCFGAAAFIVLILWSVGAIREMSQAFYGG